MIAAPAGMVEMKLSEILRLAGVSLDNVPDAVAFVYERPTPREQALAMPANMAVTAGR
jgi:hypothetical protein